MRESIKSREESVKLVAARVDGGVASELELDQAKTLVAAAQTDLALLEKAQARKAMTVAMPWDQQKI